VHTNVLQIAIVNSLCVSIEIIDVASYCVRYKSNCTFN